MKELAGLLGRFSESVAILHLTTPGLRGTVVADSPDGSTMLKACTPWSRLPCLGLASLLLACVLAAPGAQAANFFEKNFGLFGPRYDGISTPCERALNTVAWQFAEKESTFWNSNLTITGFADVHEIAYRPWQPNTIPRRYCTGTAMVSDGQPRTVNFSIIEDGGFASIGWGVEFCVVGLDRNWAYNPTCRMARP